MHVPLSRAGKLHWRNTKEQLALVGPSSLGVSLLTAAFVGMVFTIQVCLGKVLVLFTGDRPCKAISGQLPAARHVHCMQAVLHGAICICQRLEPVGCFHECPHVRPLWRSVAPAIPTARTDSRPLTRSLCGSLQSWA